MLSKEQRKLVRMKTLTLNQVDLHSNENNSFHFNLTPLESWDLLSKLSYEEYFHQTGNTPSHFVDKTKVCVKKVS